MDEIEISFDESHPIALFPLHSAFQHTNHIEFKSIMIMTDNPRYTHY